MSILERVKTLKCLLLDVVEDDGRLSHSIQLIRCRGRKPCDPGNCNGYDLTQLATRSQHYGRSGEGNEWPELPPFALGIHFVKQASRRRICHGRDVRTLDLS
jgi:hypothetical protein